MFRGMSARVLPAIGMLAAALVVAAGVAPAAAVAAPVPASPLTAPQAPKTKDPVAIQVAGKGIEGGKLVIPQDQRPEMFDLLMTEIGWLASATPHTTAPRADKLGQKYVVTVLVKNAPTQVYDLYPEAAGGPRAHRPGKQPTGKKAADGWFYGRVTMPEALRLSGAPLKERTDLMNGGIGGGIGEDVAVDEIDPVSSVNSVLAETRKLFLLNGAFLVIILFGLAGIAFLIRRRV